MPLEFTPIEEKGLEFTPVGAEPGEFNKPREALRAILGAGKELVDIPSATANLLSWPLRAAAAVPAAIATAPFIRPQSAITGDRTSLADAFSEALAGHTETGRIPYLGEKYTGIEDQPIAKMEATEHLIGQGLEHARRGAHAVVNQLFEKGIEAEPGGGMTIPPQGGGAGQDNPLLATILETLATAGIYGAPGAIHPVGRTMYERGMPGRAFGRALESDIQSTILKPDEAIRIGQPEPVKRFELDKVSGPEGDEARAAFRLPL